jgi:hypothetical protein
MHTSVSSFGKPILISPQLKFQNQVIYHFMSYKVANLITLPSSSFPPQNHRFHSIDSLSKMCVLNGIVGLSI